MSTDMFEDTLRTMLQESADAQAPAAVDVDPAVVVGRGRRVVRRRRAAVGVGVAAAGVAVGLVGMSVMGSGNDRASVPAAPSVTRAATSVTAVLDRFSDLGGVDGRPLSIPGPRRIAVTVDPTATPDLVYSAVADDGSRTMLGGSSLAGIDRLGSTWGTGGDGSHVLVGVLPEEAVQLQLVTPLTDEGGHAATTVTAPLPGTGRQAFAVRFAEASDAAAVRHLLWWAEDSTVHDENGTLVPSVALGDADGTVVYVCEALGRLGTFSARDGASMTALDGSRNSSRRPVLASGRGTGDRIDGLFAAVVPATAEPGALAPAPGTEVTTPLTKAPVRGADLAVLWSRYTYPKDATGSGYVSVTWTEDGRRVTERP